MKLKIQMIKKRQNLILALMPLAFQTLDLGPQTGQFPRLPRRGCPLARLASGSRTASAVPFGASAAMMSVGCSTSRKPTWRKSSSSRLMSRSARKDASVGFSRTASRVERRRFTRRASRGVFWQEAAHAESAASEGSDEDTSARRYSGREHRMESACQEAKNMREHAHAESRNKE